MIKARIVQPERRLQIVGEITHEAYKEFSKDLYELEHQGNDPVAVELCSEGGNAMIALAFASRIRLSKCKIVIIAYGEVASAAVLILAAGHSRLMTSESWVMVHEDSGKLSGNVVELERDSKHLRNLETQWNDILSKYTKMSAKSWEHMHKKTTYLTADECLKSGLVDKIV